MRTFSANSRRRLSAVPGGAKDRPTGNYSGPSGRGSRSPRLAVHAQVADAEPLTESSELLEAVHVDPPVELHFGLILRRAREQRGLSVHELAQKTRISDRWIVALEDARIDVLPAPVFVSGYVRSCARVLGLDERELSDQYKRLSQERLDKESRSEGPSMRLRGQKIGLRTAAIAAACLAVFLCAVFLFLWIRVRTHPA